MAVHGEGLELIYRRTARRRGGLEAAIGAVSLVDLSPRAAFPCFVSPGAFLLYRTLSRGGRQAFSRNVPHVRYALGSLAAFPRRLISPDT